MVAMATSREPLMHAPVAVFDPINIAMAGLTGRETERHTLHSLS